MSDRQAAIEALLDPKTYLEKFTKIKGKTPGLIPFILTEAQKDLFNTLRRMNRIVALKARQIGFSTAISGFLYHKTITTPGTTTALVAHKSEVATEFLDKIKTFWRTTPDSLRPRIHFNSKYEMSFPAIDSKIQVMSGQNVGRGYTIHNALCMAGDTEVYTRGGLPVLVSDLRAGTEILNGSGGFSRVKAVVARENTESLLSIDVVGSTRPLRVTKDHKVFVRGHRSGRKKGEWLSARDLRAGDRIGFPRTSYRSAETYVDFNDYVNDAYASRTRMLGMVPAGYVLGMLVGWYLSEGAIIRNRHGGENAVSFSVHEDEVEHVIQVCSRALKTKELPYRVERKEGSRGVVLVVYSVLLSRWLYDLCGSGHESKTLPEKLWRFSADFLKGVLHGAFRGDGSFVNIDRVSFTTTSHSLAFQLRRLCVSLRYGMPSVKIYRNRYRYGVKNKDISVLTLAGPCNYKIRKDMGLPLKQYKDGRNQYRLKRSLGINLGAKTWLRGTFHYWMKVRSVADSHADAIVYDIVLDREPHSFLTQGGIIHNCSELAQWERPDEMMLALENAVPKDGKIIVESCVAGDTLVLTDSGPVYMEDVFGWKNHGPGFSKGKVIRVDGHYGLKETNDYYNSGVQDGFRVTTRSGNNVTMSSVHRMFVLRGSRLEFVKAEDLRSGDFFAVKYGQNLWGNNDIVDWEPTPYTAKNKQWIQLFRPKRIDTDLAYLIGLILGDGYVDFKQGRVIITTTDAEVADFLLAYAPLRFRRAGDGIHYVCKNNSFVEFLDWLGMEKVRAPEKRIPRRALGWSASNVAAMLSGLFDADGGVHEKKREVNFYSTSKRLIDEVRVLLLNFGIRTRTYPVLAAPTTKVRVWSRGYSMELSSGNSRLFGERIGFRIARKQNRISHDAPLPKRIIPGIGKVMRHHLKDLGLTYADVQEISNKGLFSPLGGMTYETVSCLMERAKRKDSDVYREIVELISHGYGYDEVVRKERTRAHVYDFHVPDGNTVVYNGIVGHQTPFGVGNLFHRMWMAPDNGYEKKEYGWWWHYTPEEIEQIRKRINDPLKFAQEYELEFLASGRQVFDPHMIHRLQKKILKVGDAVKLSDGSTHLVSEIEGGLRIYKPPEKGRFYVVGADVAEGVAGGDFSTCSIYDRTSGEEVAFYRGHLPADKFGERLAKWGRMYNEALMVVEVNNHGLTTVTALKGQLYPNLYFRPSKFDTLGMNWSDRLGWKTTRVTRPLMIDDMNDALRENSLVPHSKELIDEMVTFVYDSGNNMVPMDGFHDDCIFSVAICFQGFKVLYDKPLVQLDYEQHLPRSTPY